MSRPTAECGYCTDIRSLKQNGTFRKHTNMASDSGMQDVCPGSGQTPVATVERTAVRDAHGATISVGSMVLDFRHDDAVGIVTDIEWDPPSSADRGVAWLTVDEVRAMTAGGHVSTGRVFRSVRASRVTVVPAPAGPTPVVPDHPATVVPELQVGPAIVPGMVRTVRPELTAPELLGIAPVCQVVDVYRASGLVKTPECFVPITAEQASALVELDARPDGPALAVIVAEGAGAHRMLVIGTFESVVAVNTWWAPRWNKLSRFRLVVVPARAGTSEVVPEPASEEGPEQRNAAVLADWLFQRRGAGRGHARLPARSHSGRGRAALRRPRGRVQLRGRF
jgi:hypothetical protein